MSISQLSLTDFRNLKSTTLDFHPALNLISGNNGSGKTSLLESIHVLCQAHSFRTHALKQCIRHGQNGFLLFGRFSGFKAGLSKSADKIEIKVNGETIKRRSELVRRTPVNVLNSSSFELIDGVPQVRRKFLDWCLFHVEHQYADLWIESQHALRQRNRLLKTTRDLRQLDYWDQALIEPAVKLSQLRKEYVLKLGQVIETEFSEIVQGLNPLIEYIPGWPKEGSLETAIENSRARDLKTGFTNCGIHRDNLRLTSGGIPAGEILSRGQSKRFCLSLVLGLLKLVQEKGNARTILLIDDLNSELDQESREMVYQRLSAMQLQLFISNVEPDIPLGVSTKEVKMFHVEHGIIKPRNFS
ncbi:MAG: DNA replication/repair protein RecF [Pseudomonadota bacterium]